MSNAHIRGGAKTFCSIGRASCSVAQFGCGKSQLEGLGELGFQISDLRLEISDLRFEISGLRTQIRNSRSETPPRFSRAVAGTGLRVGRGVAGARVRGIVRRPGLTLCLQSGEQLAVERVYPLLMLLAALAILVRSSRLVVQVPLVGDVGVLQAVGPAADLAGDGFAARFEIWDFKSRK